MKGYPLPLSENEKQFRDSKIKEDLVERFVWAHRNEFWKKPEDIRKSMNLFSIDKLFDMLKSYINHGISIYPRKNEVVIPESQIAYSDSMIEIEKYITKFEPYLIPFIWAVEARDYLVRKGVDRKKLPNKACIIEEGKKLGLIIQIMER